MVALSQHIGSSLASECRDCAWRMVQARQTEAERRRARNWLLSSLKHVSVDTLPHFQDIPTEEAAATAAATSPAATAASIWATAPTPAATAGSPASIWATAPTPTAAQEQHQPHHHASASNALDNVMEAAARGAVSDQPLAGPSSAADSAPHGPDDSAMIGRLRSEPSQLDNAAGAAAVERATPAQWHGGDSGAMQCDEPGPRWNADSASVGHADPAAPAHDRALEQAVMAWPGSSGLPGDAESGPGTAAGAQGQGIIAAPYQVDAGAHWQAACSTEQDGQPGAGIDDSRRGQAPPQAGSEQGSPRDPGRRVRFAD